jgi:NADH-quinone oxidoreductase subunit A
MLLFRIDSKQPVMTSLYVISEILLWPFVLYTCLVVLVAAGMIGLSAILGQRSKGHSKNIPYESGVELTGSARLRFPAKFYLIAMFFVLFDIETVFVVAWAIAFRDLGWAGYAGVSVFIGLLLVVLIYEFRTGALNFETSGKEILDAVKKRRAESETDKKLRK